MKRSILFCFSLLVLSSCDSFLGGDDDDDVTMIPDQELYVRWTGVGSLGQWDPELPTGFNTAYWDNNGIYFEDSFDNNGNMNWMSIEDLIIGGTGQIGVLEVPYGRINRTENGIGVTYSTRISPDFYLTPPNSNELILGGDGFSPEYYEHDFGTVVQGGYIKVTDYNERYIAGECYLVGWVFSESLNREVMAGAYLEFSGVEFRP